MRQVILMRRPYREYKNGALDRRFLFPFSFQCAAHIGAVPAQWRIKGKPLHASNENPPLTDLDETDRALVAAATSKPAKRKDLAKFAGYPALADLDARINRLMTAGLIGRCNGGLVRGSIAP